MLDRLIPLSMPMPTTPTLHAVLTGDLIESRALDDQELAAAQRVIRQGAKDYAKATGHKVPGAPDFFRGDAWQLLLDSPATALRLALLLRARLRAATLGDTRIAIGIGSTRRVNRRKTSLSSGQAFELSGHALDRMSGYFDLTAAVPHDVGWAAEWLPVVMHLCSELARDWTTRQAETVAVALLHPDATHEQIGTLLPKPVKKQTVTSALRSAHYRALLEALRLFEDCDWPALLITDDTR
ncbi:MAG: hypothetical protein AAGA68_08370 [Pseudomonadota bacterium]